MQRSERLTHARASGIKSGYWTEKKKDELTQRLGEYEDTELSPGEIKAIASSQTDSVVASDAGFNKYLENVKSMSKEWRKEGLGYLSRREQLVDVILAIEDEKEAFTVGQLKQMFALTK